MITSADKRVPGVFAYNSYGNLKDTISNPGEAILFERIDLYIENERKLFQENKERLIIEAEETIFKQLPKERQKDLIKKGFFDSNGKRIKTKVDFQYVFCFETGDPNQIEPGHESTTYGKWETKYHKAPLVKTVWNQIDLYNDMIPTLCNDNNQATVGCAAVAVGQLLGYHKKPAVFKGRTMNWNEMTIPKYGNMFTNIHWVNQTAKEDIQYLFIPIGRF